MNIAEQNNYRDSGVMLRERNQFSHHSDLHTFPVDYQSSEV